MGHQAKVKFERRMERTSGETPESVQAKPSAKRIRRSASDARNVILDFKPRVGHWNSQTDKRIEHKRQERDKKRGRA